MKTPSKTPSPKPTVILATQSARRIEILKTIKLSFIQEASRVEEIKATPKDDPLALVLANATLKAKSPYLAKKYPEALIIGVDTVVSCNGKIFEKPKNHAEAREMLEAYLTYPAGVHTGVALYESASGRVVSASDTTLLEARKDVFLERWELEQFFNEIVSLDKSGGFSIEGLGSILFDKIDGSFYTVVGMPLHVLYKVFREAGVNMYDYLKR